MTTQFIHVGDHLVSLAHIIAVSYSAPEPGGKEEYDSDSGETFITKPQPAKLKVTTTAIESGTGGWDHSTSFGEYAMPRSVWYSTRGREAEDVWALLADRFTTYPDPRQGEVTT